MAQENGSPFKLVYSDWWHSRKYLAVRSFKFPIPNGLHPAFVKKAVTTFSNEQLTNPHLLQKSMMRTQILSDTFQQKDPVTGLDNGNFFRHGNFLGYWHKCAFLPETDGLDYNYILNPDEVDVNDDIIYYYPIEIELNGLRLLSEEVKITVDGTNYNYNLVDTWNPKLLELFKIGKVKILVVNIVDSSGPIDYIKKFEDKIVEKGIDSKNLVWLQGDVPNYYYNPERKYKSFMVSGCLSLRQAAENYKKFPAETGYTANIRIISDIMRESDLDKTKVRPHKFLSFNRTMDRPHRLANAYMLLKHNLLDQGIFSFLNNNNPSYALDHLRRIFPNEPISKLEFFANKLNAIMPYQVDTHQFTNEERQGFQTIDINPKEIYASTYLNIVTETNGWDEIDRFWSEKIWRPILNLQPFIFIGPYRSLHKLKELGFKTFHPFIDESYDNERDMTVRILMIEKEIVKFKNMSIQEIHDWYYSITDVLIHNQKHMDTFTNYNPIKALWDLEYEYRK